MKGKKMTKREAENYRRTVNALGDAGFTYTEIDQLFRIERVLTRWSEMECGAGNDYASWSIERDETTGKPYLVTYPHTGKSTRRSYPDKEAGALKRLAAIMANYPLLQAYHQSDPRGCALYIVRTADLKGQAVEQCYNRGVAVCY